MSGGLYDFFYCFMPQPDDYPFDTRLHNLLEAVPNDDDLMRVYDEDRKRHIANVKENHKQMLKAAKLKIFFNCSWEGFVKIKDSVIDTTNGSRIGWHNAYIVLHGHRLVWWNSVEDINSGRAPVGQVLLFGHAGVSHASPLDIKEFGDDGRLLSVFGKDNASEQRKITLLCKSSSACQTLATAIQKLLQSYGK